MTEEVRGRGGCPMGGGAGSTGESWRPENGGGSSASEILAGGRRRRFGGGAGGGAGGPGARVTDGLLGNGPRGRHPPLPPLHLPLVAFILMLWATPSLGGMCWTSKTKSGHCKELISHRMGREDCCSAGGATTAWSAQELDPGPLFFWRALGGGVPCQACKETCTGVKCGEGKRCIIRKGRPKCACALDCRHRKGSNKGQRGPVCGSDGRSYSSVCRLRKRSCRKKSSDLTIAYYGHCQKAATCRTVHCREGQSCLTEPLSGRPRCVTCSQRCPRNNRKTTAAPAHANSSAPPHERGNNSTMPKKSGGQNRGWSSWGPLCGSNDQTYDSWCQMLKDACATGFVISTKHFGSCDAEGIQL
ncbi:follistatin-related protein 3 isoform X2 [Hetaerina americana]|uniref:follistatin-related protein 3 isoform X2 n=1 Tax=Hetaerina americana TaxID=62018 RepID=UPI003A7F555C